MPNNLKNSEDTIKMSNKPVKNSGLSNLRKPNSFSKPQLAIFILAFGAIGFFIIRSFAASAVVASLEAEQMSLPAGSTVVTDTSASSGKAIQFTANGAATGSVSFPSAINSFTVVAKGVQCKGAPLMTVTLDNTPLVSNISVSSTSWSSYSGAPTIGAGAHNLSVSFTNAYAYSGHGKKGSGSCARSLSVDVTTFSGDTTPPPALPTVTLSASPTSVSAGQSSTLTWASTNATSCSASGAWNGDPGLSGSKSTGALNQTSIYTLACTGAGGTSQPVTATVTVSAPQVPPAPTIYFNPPSQGYSVGSTITLDVRENSGTAGVNAVQANFSYPANLLTFVSADGSSSGFTTQAQSTGANGQVTLARGVIGNLTGDQLISKVTFTVSGAGVANLSFINGTSLINATTNQNIISSLSADGVGVYTLQ